MKYGLIGEHLSHSYSKEIHSAFGNGDYELAELSPSAVGAFLLKKDFCGINVTVPYKETVLPYLDEIDPRAKEIQAVNTVLCRAGKLFGYNTDYDGIRRWILRHLPTLAGKCVAILGGDGGTARTAAAVAKDLGAERILRVSRRPREGFVGYEDESLRDAHILMNATPVGMYPNTEECPISLEKFPKLELVLDAVYHPLRTELLQQAEEKKIPGEGGLFLLVAQGAAAHRYFTGNTIDEPFVEQVFRTLREKKENLVLVGMPGCGKSTVGRRFAKESHRRFFDTDEEVEKRVGMPISDFFAGNGEAKFRQIETQVIRDLVKDTRGSVIATGGGAVLSETNVKLLKQNGRLIFLDREPQYLLPSQDRPLARSVADVKRLYGERYSRYLAVSDERISVGAELDSVLADFGKDKR